MRDEENLERQEAPLTELGGACELTHGTFMPHLTEQVFIKDYFDQP